MGRKIRVNKAKELLTDLEWAFLCDKPMPENNFDAFILKYDKNGTNEELWNLHKDVILAEHIKTEPGTRPSCWWKYSAPKSPIGTYPGCGYDGELCEPRERLSGVGEPDFLVKNIKPSFDYGIPDGWAGIDPNDLPIYESEAAYLKRNGLLMPGEEKRSDFDISYVPVSWDNWPELLGNASEIAAARQ